MGGWNPVFAHFSGAAVLPLTHRNQSPGFLQRLLVLLKAHPSSQTMPPSLGVPVVAALPVCDQLDHYTSHSETTLLNRSRRGDFDVRLYDVFLSHNWGTDTHGRDNHERVHHIAKVFRRNGLEVFLDIWEIAKYDSIDEAMVAG